MFGEWYRPRTHPATAYCLHAVREREREREGGGCVCVCVCVREREREIQYCIFHIAECSTENSGCEQTVVCGVAGCLGAWRKLKYCRGSNRKHNRSDTFGGVIGVTV